MAVIIEKKLFYRIQFAVTMQPADCKLQIANC
jgi:hypothetical protein